jgi:hypothetical protein
MKACDLLVQVESGLAGMIGHPAGPGPDGVSGSNIACDLAAYTAVLTGQGRTIAVSLVDGTGDWMRVPLPHAEGKPAALRPGWAWSIPSSALMALSPLPTATWHQSGCRTSGNGPPSPPPCCTTRRWRRGLAWKPMLASTNHAGANGTVFGLVNNLQCFDGASGAAPYASRRSPPSTTA